MRNAGENRHGNTERTASEVWALLRRVRRRRGASCGGSCCGRPRCWAAFLLLLLFMVGAAGWYTSRLRVLQLLPHHGAVLQVVAGIEPQGRALHRVPLCAGVRRQDSRQDAGAGAVGQVRHQERRAPARRPRCPTPVASARAATKPACSPAAWSTRASISTTRRTWANSAAASSCAAPVATARSCRASTWR